MGEGVKEEGKSAHKKRADKPKHALVCFGNPAALSHPLHYRFIPTLQRRDLHPGECRPVALPARLFSGQTRLSANEL